MSSRPHARRARAELWLLRFAALAALAAVLPATVHAFVGGRLSPLRAEVRGGLLFGSLWTVVVVPVALAAVVLGTDRLLGLLRHRRS